MVEMQIVRKPSGEIVAADPAEASSFGWSPVQQQTITSSGLTPAGTPFSITTKEFVEKKEEKPTPKQLELKEMERVKKDGGGYSATSGGVQKISGDKDVQYREVINAPVKDSKYIIQILLPPKETGVGMMVEKAGGWEYILQQSEQMNQQREIERTGRNVIFKAVQLASQGNDEVMRTPDEVAREQEKLINAYRYAFKAAKEPIANPLEFYLYGIYDPFGIRTSLEASRVRALGGTKEQALEAGWKAGRFSYEYQKATDTFGFSANIGLSAGSLAAIAVFPMIKSPVVRTSIALPTIFATEYQLTTDMINKSASFPSVFLQLTTIGLASQTVYSGVREIYQNRLVDNVLKDINVKEYQEQKVSKFVPKYGEEKMIRETISGDVKTREFYQRDILGKPQDTIPEIKDSDKGIKLIFTKHDQGIDTTKTITFKLTDEGWKPMGNVKLDEWIPDQKKLFRILDNINTEKIDISKGFVEKYVITPQNILKQTTTSSYIIPEETVSTLKIEWVGLEKPEVFSTNMIKPSSVPSSTELKFLENVQDMADDKSSFLESLGIKDLTKVGGISQINYPSGEIQSHATTVSLQPQPEILDILKVETPVPTGYIHTTSVPNIFVNVPDTTGLGSINVPLITPLIMTVPRQKEDMMLTQMKMTTETPKPIDIIRMGSGNVPGMTETPIPITFQAVSPMQSQANLQKLDQITISMVAPPSPYITPERIPTERPQPTDTTDIPMPAMKKWEEEEEKESKRIDVKNIFGTGFILPTASFVSLERAAVRFGTGSLARGKSIERKFGNIIQSEGLSAEFPAAEFLRTRKPRRKKTRRVKLYG